MKKLFYAMIIMFVVSVTLQGCGLKTETADNSKPPETSQTPEISDAAKESEENLPSRGQVRILPPEGEGQIGLAAVVLSEELPVHQDPDADSEVVNTLQYGDTVILLRQSDGWGEYVASDDVDEVPGGWIETDDLLIDPAWLLTNEETPLYARNDITAPEIASLDENVIAPVLKDEGEWFMVSPGGGNAVGWIHDEMAERIEPES